jgi:hypothetical protein
MFMMFAKFSFKAKLPHSMGSTAAAGPFFFPTGKRNLKFTFYFEDGSMLCSQFFFLFPGTVRVCIVIDEDQVLLPFIGVSRRGY